MYVSRHHQLTDHEAILALIEAHPLAAWVCHSRDGLVANHIPLSVARKLSSSSAICRIPMPAFLARAGRCGEVFDDHGLPSGGVREGELIGFLQ